MSASALFTPPAPTFPQSGGGGGNPIMIGDAYVNKTINNTPFEDTLIGLPYNYSVPSGVNKVRLTYTINCNNGMPNNEQLFMYGGLENSNATQLLGSVYNNSLGNQGCVSSAVNVGGGVHIATNTFVDYVDITDTTYPFRPMLFMRISNGSHSLDFRIFVSAEILT